MGVLYLWITTSLVSGTMPMQETKQRIQRQQEPQWVNAWELWGITGVDFQQGVKWDVGQEESTTTVGGGQAQGWLVYFRFKQNPDYVEIH